MTFQTPNVKDHRKIAKVETNVVYMRNVLMMEQKVMNANAKKVITAMERNALEVIASYASFASA